MQEHSENYIQILEIIIRSKKSIFGRRRGQGSYSHDRKKTLVGPGIRVGRRDGTEGDGNQFPRDRRAGDKNPEELIFSNPKANYAS